MKCTFRTRTRYLRAITVMSVKLMAHDVRLICGLNAPAWKLSKTELRAMDAGVGGLRKARGQRNARCKVRNAHKRSGGRCEDNEQNDPNKTQNKPRKSCRTKVISDAAMKNDHNYGAEAVKSWKMSLQSRLLEGLSPI
jgi:hypothetical protein